MMKDILDAAKADFKKVEGEFIKEILKFRTGRASVSILDGILIDYYGTPTPIQQLATLGVPEANLIIIQPWDNKTLGDIDKAIRNANIGISPVSDGKVIKLPVPPLDEQRRLEIVKMLKKYMEERKTVLRNIRRDYRDMAKTMKDDKEITEDDEKRFYDELQKMVDGEMAKIEEMVKTREKHIMDD
jgi:ribosome recycling factor